MPEKVNHKGTVFIAMSGGVDSSVAALLLKHAGWRVVGVFMKPWQPASPPAGGCMWEAERSDALRVASALDIPLETWDFSRQYGRLVAAPMVDAYRRGTTPNPDVECNRHIKFGLFYRRAIREGADFVATGHYAQIKTRSHSLVRAKDKQKDQTYFLWGLGSHQLARILFPVGGLLKSQVREIARRHSLVTAGKKDSQGVCFVGELDMKSYLSSVIRPKSGPILHVDGRRLGTHDGAGYYTIGQRHGLDIQEGGGPYYVVKKDMRANTVTVGGARDLETRHARVSRIHWLGPKPEAGSALQAMIRYRSKAVPATLKGSMLTFLKPVRAVAPGQSVVFYRGTEVLGGAILS